MPSQPIKSDGASKDLPAWARTLLKRPLIEIRRGISFGNDPPAEDSSVIALTALSGKYVDIRFQGSLPADEQHGSTTSNDLPGFATAGLCIPHMPEKGRNCPAYECCVYVSWEHPIDSSRSFKTDGADMYLLGNGDIMEIGVMPIRGELQLFKEYWIWPDTTSATFLVMETVGTDCNDKGMLVMINGYCQAVLQTDDHFWMERWHAEESKEWVRDGRSNTTEAGEVLPCKWAVLQPRILGDRVTLQGRIWEVTEVS